MTKVEGEIKITNPLPAGNVYSFPSPEEEHRRMVRQLAREFMPTIIQRENTSYSGAVDIAYEYAEAFMKRAMKK